MLVTGALRVMTTTAACTSLFSPAQTLTNAPKSTQTGKPRWKSADRFVRRAERFCLSEMLSIEAWFEAGLLLHFLNLYTNFRTPPAFPNYASCGHAAG